MSCSSARCWAHPLGRVGLCARHDPGVVSVAGQDERSSGCSGGLRTHSVSVLSAASGSPVPPWGALHHPAVPSTASGSPHASWCSAPPRGALRRQARASPRGPLAAFPLGRPASDGPRGLVSRAAAPAAPVVLLSKRRDVLVRPQSLCRTGRSRTPWAPSAFPPAPGWVGSPDRVGLAASLPPRPRPTRLGAPLCSLEGKQTLIDPTKHAVGEAVIPAACGNPSAGGLIHSV